ncbi:MAG: 4-(cytidine 5'-diphospho)-2-C-methyl-D-erythritol kinase [Gemmatimonadaceae bacterium]
MSKAGRTLAQAKINLALRVLGKQPDGYHSIETVFLRVDFGDEVRLHIREKARTVRCAAMPDHPQAENLAYRAAALFSDETGWPGGFEVEIDKHIPIGGGLGGGSADAAAVLRILNELSANPLPTSQLLELAGKVGSDVPFLASDYPMALAWGRGEQMTELPPLPPRDVHLVVPPFAVSTAEAYSTLDRMRGGNHRPPEFTTEMFKSWQDAAKNSVNDFENVVRDRFQQHGLSGLFEARGGRGALFVRMTGSGSTVFIIEESTMRTSGPALAGLSRGAKIITTRTATSVVPVEVLD